MNIEMTVDYTTLRPGTPWGGEVIECCPRCGKIGLFQMEHGTRHAFYLHKEKVDHLGHRHIEAFCAIKKEKSSGNG